jgi:ABC-type transport system involved in multi-copper enzyme maturation permease subunit
MRRSIGILFALVAGFAVACVYLPPWVPGSIAFLLLVAASLRTRWQRVGLVGPVFHAELLRTTRRSRVWLLRVGYLGIVLVVLTLTYWSWGGKWRAPTSADLAYFTLGLFYAFLIAQLVALLALAPAVTAGAIAEERERGSMTFLLATDLRDHEIVLGKFAARLVHLLGLVLAGLPIFSLMQLLGGIDLALVGFYFAGTLVTVLSVAAVSLLTSALCCKVRSAIILAYLVVVGYAVLVPLVANVVELHGLKHFPSTDTWTSPAELGDVVGVVGSGHAGFVLVQPRRVLGSSRGLGGTEFLAVLGRYALFHGVLALLCVGLAMIFLRRVGVGEAVPGRSLAIARPAREVGDDPVRWREIWADHGWTGRVPAQWLIVILVGASLLLLRWGTPAGQFGGAINLWCRVLGGTLATLILLLVVLRAAGSIRGEMDRNTFEPLLTTPLSAQDILFSKLFGALGSGRILVCGLLVVWGVGLFTGGLNPLMIPCQALALRIFAGALASFALWISLTTKTALRAMFLAVGGTLLLSLGHWVLWVGAGAPSPVGTSAPSALFLLLAAVFCFGIALTPPLAFGVSFGFGFMDFPPSLRWLGESVPLLLPTALLALACWALFGRLMWNAALSRLRSLHAGPEDETPSAESDPQGYFEHRASMGR